MRREILRAAARAGLVAGIVVVFESLVGMVEKFASLAIVGTRGTLNWVLIGLPSALAAYLSVRSRVVAGEEVETPTSTALVAGAIAGLGAGAVAAAFIGVVNAIGVETVQTVFVQVSHALMGILTFHMGTWAGTALLVALLTVLGIAGAGLRLLRPSVRRPILNGLTTVLVMGLLQRVVPPALDQIGIDRSLFYSSRSLGLTPWGALIVFVAAAAVTVSGIVPRLRRLLTERPSASSSDDADHPLGRRMPTHTLALIIAWVLLAILLVVLPYLVGTVVSQILGTIGIYLLLGLGLNIVVGFAGLLDLGYVAFFAVGAYLTAILTGGERAGVPGFTPPAFGAHLSFFVALPIVMAVAALIGVLIGAPVLRLRGDYLAIVTLGFGEIARVIFGSDWAGPLFGGALGMTHVTGAPILGFNFQEDARHFYYLVLFFCLIAIYVSYRLQGSRVGRAWNAMREDEQVADAMGISTTRYKLLAFAMGGAIGSVGGALFAVQIGSLTIATFQVLVSITVLALIILGGLGSVPGVIVGALVLIGLPGVLSEFEDYRLLIYGAVLIAIMLLRPQGLVPNVRRSRELHEDERAQDEWGKTTLEAESAVALEPTAGEL